MHYAIDRKIEFLMNWLMNTHPIGPFCCATTVSCWNVKIVHIYYNTIKV
jgi:hypothetical protein